MIFLNFILLSLFPLVLFALNYLTCKFNIEIIHVIFVKSGCISIFSLFRFFSYFLYVCQKSSFGLYSYSKKMRMRIRAHFCLLLCCCCFFFHFCVVLSVSDNVKQHGGVWTRVTNKVFFCDHKKGHVKEATHNNIFQNKYA